MRPRNTFISPDHELACLTYEQALKQGLDADYGNHPEGGYWVEVYDCTVGTFATILLAAEGQMPAQGEVIPRLSSEIEGEV